jgi:hypothetical protein
MWGFIGLAYMITSQVGHLYPVPAQAIKQRKKRAIGYLKPYRLLEIFEEQGCVIAVGSTPAQLNQAKNVSMRTKVTEEECKDIAKSLGEWLKSKGAEPMTVWSLLNKFDDMVKKNRFRSKKQEAEFKNFRRKNKV